MDGSLAGKLLIAMPGIGDPRFEKAVIMMCLHTEEHAMGLVVNKPRDELKLKDVLSHLGIAASDAVAPRAVLDGGPVRPDRGYVLHSEDFTTAEATQAVAPGIRLTATRDVLEAVAGEHAPHLFMLALGCSGWGAGQLENEMRQNAWLVVEPATDDAIIFGENHETKWESAIKRLGFDPAQIAGDIGRA
ncbi:MAG: YqgE/AlgH family protein [Hyphomonadaceae bacterium]